MIIIFLFIIIAILALIYEYKGQKDNILIYICFIILILISGTRLVGGTDFDIYEQLYYETPNNVLSTLSMKKSELNYEKGYIVISSLFKNLGFSFYGFCLFHAIFFYSCLWYGMKYFTKHMGLILILFMYKLFFYDTFISMRQSITLALFFVMLRFIVEKKWIYYYILCFLAAQVHNGAYLLFLVYPLTYIKLDKNRIRLVNMIFFPTLFIGLAGIDVLGPLGSFLASNTSNHSTLSKIDGYFNSNEISSISLFHTIEYYIIMILIYKNMYLLNLRDKKVQISLMMFTILLPLFTLFRVSEILTREKDYFILFYVVVIGYIIDRLNTSKRTFYISLIVLLSTLGYYRFTLQFDNGAMLNYNSWLFNNSYSIFL